MTHARLLAAPSLLFALGAPCASAQQTAPEFLARHQILSPPDLNATARFGFSMDAEGGILVVGAPQAQGFVAGSTNGACIVYERNAADAWIEVQRFLAPSWAVEFGGDVAISGERIVVGSRHTGAWVFDRQPNGTWSETTWLGLTPNPGGTKVAVDEDVVVCRRNLQTFAFNYPGFDVWERQSDGTWMLVPVVSALGFDNLPARDLGVDDGVIVELYADYFWHCADQDLDQSGTRAYVRGPTGWTPAPSLHTYSEGTIATFAFGDGVVATFGIAPRFPSGNCTYAQDPCGACLAPSGGVVNLTGALGSWGVIGIYATWPHVANAIPTSIDIQDGRLAALTIEAGTTHVFLQKLPMGMVPAPAAMEPIGYTRNPIVSTQSPPPFQSANQDVEVNDRQVFVSKWDEGRGVVYVLGESTFAASSPTASLGAAADVSLSLDVGPTYAGRPFMILGSATGTFPGVPLDHGVTIPLVVDGYTYFTLDGAPHIVGQVGSLDIAGKASATIDIPPGLGYLAGLTIHHAFVWFDLAIFALRASDPVSTLLVP
jgi:hypothetical protein